MANDIKRVVVMTGLTNSKLKKKLLYSWEKEFIEDKEDRKYTSFTKMILRKDEVRKPRKTLFNPLKGKVLSESDYTIRTTRRTV